MSVTVGSVKITSGGTVSTPIDTDGMALAGIETPGTLTSIALTFQGSPDPPVSSSGDPTPVFNQITDTTGAALTVTVAANRLVAVNPANFSGFRQIKVVAGTAELADRIVRLVLRAHGT